MDNSLMTQGQNKIDSWKQMWNMPGGTMAKTTAVGAALGIGFGFFKALPMLIAGAANTLIFIGELVAIATILMILTSKDFWKWISIFWYQLNRKLLSFFVKIDPISILERSIYELRKKLDVVNENVTKLGGVLEGMKKDLKKYQDDFKQNANRRTAAQKLMSDPNISPDKALELKTNYMSICNDIARLEKIITSQQHRIDVSEKYLGVMKRLQILAKFKVKDSESELKYRAAEYEAAKAQTSALKSITSIVNGGLSQSLEAEMALAYVNDTVNQSISEMNSLLDGTSDLLTNFDLDTMANIEKVDDIIARFEKNGFASFDNNLISAQGTVAVPYQSADEPEKEMVKILATKNSYF